MSFRKHLHRHVVPSHHNSYRPHLLRKEWLMFFVAVIFASEGIFVSGLFLQQNGVSISDANVAAVAGAPAASEANTFANSFGREVAKMVVSSGPVVPWALAIIAILLLGTLAIAFFVHIQIQQSEMLFSGALVAMLALSLIITNAQIAGML